MKTYTRKKPECQLIEGVEDLCRLCLSKAEGAVPIFSDNSHNICASLAMRIMLCVGLEITQEESLPNSVCIECSNELERSYAFRKKCEVTYQRLKSHLLAVKRNCVTKLKDEKNGSKDNSVDKFKTCDDIHIRSLDVNELNILLPSVDTQQGTIQKQANKLLYVNRIDKVPSEAEASNSTASETEPSNSIPSKAELSENISTHAETEIDTPQKDPQPVDEPASELSAFLSNMLVQLGILVHHEDIVAVDQDITLEVESGDSRKITLEFVEEDEDEAPPESILTGMQENTEETDLRIKCVTSAKKDFASVKGVNPATWCGECGRNYASRSVLARHLRIHRGERPFACPDCGRAFSQAEMLARHRLLHTEIRPFRCELCPKSFTQREGLGMHARRHDPARPLLLHQCPSCPKVFLHASGLSRHIMTHKGRVYICSTCSRRFSDKSALLRHLRKAMHTTPPSTTLHTTTNKAGEIPANTALHSTGNTVLHSTGNTVLHSTGNT